MARFDRMDNGSPAEQEMQARSPNVGRSAHNFSTSVAGTSLLGMLVPVDCFDVVPTESIQMNIDAQIEFRNPTVRPLLNGFRTYFHVRYNRLIDLWEGAKNFIDKGRSGSIDLTMPNLIYKASYSNNDGHFYVNSNTPMSLLNFLKLPAEYMQSLDSRKPILQFESAIDVLKGSSVEGKWEKLSNSTDYFPAPVAFAYQRNWRDFYSNKNLLQGNKFWFPDNEDHFILSYSCEDAVCIKYEDEDLSSSADSSFAQVANLVGSEDNAISNFDIPGDLQLGITPEPNNPSVTSDLVNNTYRFYPNLAGIKFVQFRGDRFTTASPFPDLIRGDVPVIDLTKDKFINSFETIRDGHIDSYDLDSNSLESSSTGFLGNSDVDFDGYDSLGARLPLPSTSLNMSDLYTLETLHAFKKKMGMTNGDYSEMVKAQFGSDPKVHDRKATYIGGFYIDMGIQTVVQQSESNSTPLGTKSGNGLSAGSGNIGSFDVPDYGYISVYMFTIPNVYYTQGKPRMYSKSLSTDLYYPLFNNLPAQAIRNDELFISGNSSVDSAPFAYEDRYAEYKSRPNYVTGFMGLPVEKAYYDTAKIMARRFSSTPTFNHYFVSMLPENVDMSVFAMDDEPPLDFLVNIGVRRVFPGPYMAIEGSLSSPGVNL